MSSAKGFILISLSKIEIPLTAVAWRIFLDIRSAACMNRYGESGHLCLTPVEGFIRTFYISIKDLHPVSQAFTNVVTF